MRCGENWRGSPRAAGGQTKRWTVYESSYLVQSEPNWPMLGKTALESGKSAYVSSCKAVYTSSILVGAFPSAGWVRFDSCGQDSANCGATLDVRAGQGFPIGTRLPDR